MKQTKRAQRLKYRHSKRKRFWTRDELEALGNVLDSLSEWEKHLGNVISLSTKRKTTIWKPKPYINFAKDHETKA